MAKIAGRSYPGELNVEEAEEWMQILVNEYGGRAESKEAFAQDVGHKSTKSGAFNRKVADARKYSILTPRGSYEATELGFQLADPVNEEERLKTIGGMLNNIGLLSDINGALNGNCPDRFWRVLTEITDANPKEARDAADWIENLYKQMIEVEADLESLGAEDSAPDDSEKSATSVENQPEEMPYEQEQSVSEGGIFLKVGHDEFRFEATTDMNIEIAIRILESKKQDINQSSLNTWAGE